MSGIGIKRPVNYNDLVRIALSFFITLSSSKLYSWSWKRSAWFCHTVFCFSFFLLCRSDIGPADAVETVRILLLDNVKTPQSVMEGVARAAGEDGDAENFTGFQDGMFGFIICTCK